jgi:multiple sugar transport system substrate-binding protein
MKRFLIGTLVVILGLLTFTACGRNNDVELVVAWWGGDMRADHTHQILDLFLAQNDDVTYIETEFVAFGDYWTQMSIRAAGGDLPCVMQHDVSRMVEYVEGGLLLDLTPFINNNRLNLRELPSEVIDAGRVPGHPGVYAVPIGMNVAAMVYNRTLLDSLGITVPLNMTLQQFIDISREVYNRSGVRTNWAHNDASIQLELHLRAQGVNLFDGDRLGGTWENYLEFFQTVQLGLDEGWHLRPEHWAGREGAEMNAMWYPAGAENANLRTWNSQVWSNMIGVYVNDSPADMSISLTTPPSNNPHLSNFGRAAMFLAVSSQTGNVDEAVALVNFWTNSVDAWRIMDGDRGASPNVRISNAITAGLGPSAQMQSEFVGRVNAGGYVAPFVPFRPAAAGEVVGMGTSLLITIVEELTFGRITPEQAAQRFFNEGNAILG